MKLRFRSRRERQNVVPSQTLPRLTPYSNRIQMDIVQQHNLRSKKPDGYTRPEPWVITQFDARPINAYDFIATFSAAEQAGADSRQFDYIVPPGKVAIARRLLLRIYMTVANRDAVTGAPNAAITMTALVNNGPVDQVNNIRVDDAINAVVAGAFFPGVMDIPLYFIAPPDSTISLLFTNATAATDFALISPTLTGNLLLAEGVNPNSEPGTKCAVPIWGADRREQPTVIRPLRNGRS